MTTRGLLLILLVAIAMAGAVWVLQGPAPNEVVQEIDGTNGGHDAPSVAEAGTENGGEVSASDAGQKRSSIDVEKESGHRIRVLDPSGAALAGITVYFKELSVGNDESLIEIWSQPDARLRPWRFVREKVRAVTNESGIATLPSSALGVAAVFESRFSGALFVEEGDASEQASALDLQLQRVECIEVHVIDDAEQPVEGLRIDLSLADSSRLAQASGAAASAVSAEGIWEKTGSHGWSDAEGKLLLPLEFRPRTFERLGDPAALAASVWTRLTAGAFYESQFELPCSEPVTLRVASHGSLRIQLEGFPNGVAPVLYPKSLQEDFLPDAVVTESEFRFDRVPVAQSLHVGFASAVFKDGKVQSSYGLGLPLQALLGPSQPGTVEDRIIRYDPPAGISGRLIVPEHRKADVQLLGSNDFHVKGILKSKPGTWHPFQVSVFSDGQFLAQLQNPRNGEPLTNRLEDYESICFEWQRRSGRPAGRRTLYAEHELLGLEGVELHDLGDVHLLEEPVLLEVSVIDASGAPIPQAMLRLGGRMQAMPPDLVYSPPGQLFSHTDLDGKAWVQDHDWYTQFNLPYADHDESKLGAIESLVVDVSHNNHVAQRAEFDLNQRQLTVTMAASSSFEGSLVPMPEVAQVWVTLLPLGASLDNASELAVVQHGVIPVESFASFKKTGVPAGIWDVVFTVMTYGQGELLRIPQVVLQAGETCQDPRLQDVDLNGLVSRFELEFRNPEGERLQPPDLNGTLYYLARQDWGVRPEWQDARAVVVGPVGESLSAWFYDRRWLAADLSGVTPGRNEVTLYPRRSLPVVLDAVDAEVDFAAFQWELTWKVAGPVPFPALSPAAAPSELRVDLLRAGQHEITWQVLDASGAEVATATSQQQIEIATLISGSEIRATPPPALLAKLQD